MSRYNTCCCLVCLLAFIALGVGAFANSSHAQTKSSAEEDVQLLRYFSRAEFLEWERAQDMIRDGKSMIENGRWMMNRQPSIMGGGNQEDLQAARRAGAERVAEGERLVKAGEKILDDLRAKARVSKAALDAASQPTNITLEIEKKELEAALQDAIEKVLEAMQAQDRTQLYLGGVYFWEEEGYLRFGLVDRMLRDTFVRLRGEDAVPSEEDVRFTLGAKDGKLMIDCPDREAVLPSGKSALIVGEVAFDAQERRALLGIRAIDPDNLRILASYLYSLEMTSDLKTLLAGILGIPEADVAEVTEERIPSNLEGLALFLYDSRNFVGRLKTTNPGSYVFAVQASDGDTDFQQHQAVLISVQMLKEHDLEVVDTHFIPRVLLRSTENPPLGDEQINNANWIIVHEDSLGNGRELLAVEARAGSLRENIPVGKLALADTLSEAGEVIKELQ